MSRFKTITAECEIDMRDFDLSELTEELEYRMKDGKTRYKSDKQELIRWCKEILDKASHIGRYGNLGEAIKQELWEEYKDKYSIEELQRRLA